MVLLCEVPKILILIGAAARSVGLDFYMADSWLSDFVPSSSSQGDAVWCEAAFLGADVCKAVEAAFVTGDFPKLGQERSSSQPDFTGYTEEGMLEFFKRFEGQIVKTRRAGGSGAVQRLGSQNGGREHGGRLEWCGTH